MLNQVGIEDIILADDDADDVLIFTLALEQLAVTVKLRHVEDGEKLFDLLREQIPDILFLDIHMPCKDGLACIQEIRRDRRYDQMPVIMLTSLNSPYYVDQTFRLGANLFVDKQGTIANLAAKINSIFSIEWKKQLIPFNRRIRFIKVIPQLPGSGTNKEY
jgi:CheY-like chemotaxis protein